MFSLRMLLVVVMGCGSEHPVRPVFTDPAVRDARQKAGSGSRPLQPLLGGTCAISRNTQLYAEQRFILERTGVVEPLPAAFVHLQKTAKSAVLDPPGYNLRRLIAFSPSVRASTL